MKWNARHWDLKTGMSNWLRYCNIWDIDFSAQPRQTLNKPQHNLCCFLLRAYLGCSIKIYWPKSKNIFIAILCVKLSRVNKAFESHFKFTFRLFFINSYYIFCLYFLQSNIILPKLRAMNEILQHSHTCKEFHSK